MSDNDRCVLKFKDYVVEYVNFYNNDKFDANEVNVNFEVAPDIKINEDNTEMYVSLIVNVFKDAQENNYPFEMKLKVSGYFEISGDDKAENFSANAIAILFPYIRSLITNYTANANISPLILPPINVNAMISDIK